MATPQQNPLAAAAVSSRELAPLGWSSAEWDRVDADIRARAFFSANVIDADLLGYIQQQVHRLALGPSGERLEYLNPTEARTRIKEFLDSIDYVPEKGEEGTIKDLRSDQRINLILDTNVRMATGFAQHVAGQAPDALAQYPALEFLRIHRREVPRGFVRMDGYLREVTPHYWLNVWRAAGGSTYAGRMIAPKGDPIWTAISRFGVPYGPPDFNSGYGQLPVSAREARRLGVPPPTPAPATPPRFNRPGDIAGALPEAPPDMLAIYLEKISGIVHRDGNQLRWN